MLNCIIKAGMALVAISLFTLACWWFVGGQPGGTYMFLYAVAFFLLANVLSLFDGYFTLWAGTIIFILIILTHYFFCWHIHDPADGIPLFALKSTILLIVSYITAVVVDLALGDNWLCAFFRNFTGK